MSSKTVIFFFIDNVGIFAMTCTESCYQNFKSFFFFQEGVGVCEGVGLYLYERKAPNKLRDFIMVLGHPSEELCTRWVLRIQQILSGKNSYLL